ncbi:hypothetical protein LOTGIDRAFT_204950 [Lottia gigantea]|uniref:HMG box domain-containing protein n=1 Tax=Lottia gigantea TaxID=225164 RepID=V4BFI6_LOTGI|nr:hypothetical protein LOTGIDRAFT_204950 [Lottia gigantea]ESP04632.1 hypothetical protein LOTGIDRAFT_204950 [Lottia gigantea]
MKMAVKAACAKFQFNLDILSKLNQCLTTRVGSLSQCKAFSISSSKKDLIGRPKKPPGPYIIFANSVRERIRKEYPDVTFEELNKKCGQQWKELEANEKKKFSNDFARRKEAYDEQLKYFKETAETVEQKAEINMSKKARRKMKRKKLSGLGKPKAKRSAFNFFTKASCSGKDAISFSEAAERFSKLSPEEKEPYLKESEIDGERYLREIKEWEEEMIDIGRTDVIRKRRGKK